jgi:hypothetical protein
MPTFNRCCGRPSAMDWRFSAPSFGKSNSPGRSESNRKVPAKSRAGVYKLKPGQPLTTTPEETHVGAYMRPQDC